MKFVVDECTGPTVAAWLGQQGHDVVSIYDVARGAEDDDVLHRAFTDERILITSDKDFGELISREKRPHHGVVLLRLVNPSPTRQIQALDELIKNHAGSLPDHFVVVTDAGVRIVTP
jgi:predicted nuclease of predicted toxin-antitoxin system